MSFQTSVAGSLCCRVRPRAAAAAAALGITAGFAAGDNLTVCLLLTVAAVLRLPVASVLLSAAVGFAAAWLAMPLSFAVGAWALDDLGVGRLLAGVLGRTAIAVLGWDRYTIVGGLLLAPPLAIPFALTFADLQRRLAAHPWVLSAGMPRVLITPPSRWSRLGGQLAGMQVVHVDAVAPAGPLRRYWHAWLAVSLCATIALAGWLQGRATHQALLGQLAAVLGAPVSVEGWNVSNDGQLELDGLQINNPQRAGEELVRVERLTAKLADADAIWNGELRIERALVNDLRITPTASAPRVLREFATSLPPVHGGELSDAQRLPIASCFAGGDAALARLQAAQPALVVLQSHIAPDGEARSLRPSPQAGRTALCQARSSLGQRAPRLSIEYLQIENLPVCWNLGRGAILKVLALDSAPGLALPGATVELTAPELCLSATAQLSRQPESPHQVKLRFFDSLATNWLAADRSVRLQLTSGTLRAEAEGTFDDRGFELAAQATVRGVCAQIAGEELFAGLSPATWNRCLAKMPEMELRATVAGDWQQAYMSVSQASLIDALAVALRSQGKEPEAQAVVAEYRGDAPPATEVAAAPLETAAETPPAAEPLPPVTTPAPRYSAIAHPPRERYPLQPQAPSEDRYGLNAAQPTPLPTVPENVAPDAEAPYAPVPLPAPSAAAPEVAAAPAPAAPTVPEQPVVPLPAPQVAVEPEQDGLRNPLRAAAPSGGLRGQLTTLPPAPAPTSVPANPPPVAAPQPGAWRADAPVAPRPPLRRPTAPAGETEPPSENAQWTSIGPMTESGANRPEPLPVTPPAAEPAVETPVEIVGATPAVVDTAPPTPEPIDMELGYDENFPTASGGTLAVPPTVVPEALMPRDVPAPAPIAPQVGMAQSPAPPAAAAPAADPSDQPSTGLWTRVKSIFRRKPASSETAVNPFAEPEHVAERSLNGEPTEPSGGRFFRR